MGGRRRRRPADSRAVGQQAGGALDQGPFVGVGQPRDDSSVTDVTARLQRGDRLSRAGRS